MYDTVEIRMAPHLTTEPIDTLGRLISVRARVSGRPVLGIFVDGSLLFSLSQRSMLDVINLSYRTTQHSLRRAGCLGTAVPLNTNLERPTMRISVCVFVPFTMRTKKQNKHQRDTNGKRQKTLNYQNTKTHKHKKTRKHKNTKTHKKTQNTKTQARITKITSL